jgi:hypothetical protein
MGHDTTYLDIVPNRRNELATAVDKERVKGELEVTRRRTPAVP